VDIPPKRGVEFYRLVLYGKSRRAGPLKIRNDADGIVGSFK
jgi:hypothetical protein